MMIETSNVVDGQRMAASLLKRLEREDPRTCVIALATCFGFASRACGMDRRSMNVLMDTIYNQVQLANGDAAAVAQAALSDVVK